MQTEEQQSTEQVTRAVESAEQLSDLDRAIQMLEGGSNDAPATDEVSKTAETSQDAPAEETDDKPAPKVTQIYERLSEAQAEIRRLRAETKETEGKKAPSFRDDPAAFMEHHGIAVEDMIDALTAQAGDVDEPQGQTAAVPAELRQALSVINELKSEVAELRKGMDSRSEQEQERSLFYEIHQAVESDPERWELLGSEPGAMMEALGLLKEAKKQGAKEITLDMILDHVEERIDETHASAYERYLKTKRYQKRFSSEVPPSTSTKKASPTLGASSVDRPEPRNPEEMTDEERLSRAIARL